MTENHASGSLTYSISTIWNYSCHFTSDYSNDIKKMGLMGNVKYEMKDIEARQTTYSD